MEPVMARKMWRTLEPYHGLIYFAPEATAAYEALGVPGFDGYFASRAAAMGAVPAEVVMATFFNFNPTVVRHAIPSVWEATTPERLLEARLGAADAALRRATGSSLDGTEVVRAAELARLAAEGCTVDGRPLYAGHASLPWPDPPHLALWHAISLLREFRGDGHVVALAVEGLDGCEALVTHGAAGDVSPEILRATRQRSGDDWLAAEERLRVRGWLDPDLALTDLGRERRAWIERRTDELAAAPYDAIGVDGCARLRELARPISRAMTAAFG
jgi:hypothetical protein